MMLVSIYVLAHHLKSQSNQRLGVGDEHEKDQDQDQDHEHADEKAINEGSFAQPLNFYQLRLYLITFIENRVQNMEEECALPLWYDPEHSIRMANSYNPVASR